MNLTYLSAIRLPTKNAHGFQIMNMCAAFASAGIKVELVVPWRKNPLKEDPFVFYGIAPKFKITKVFAIDLFPLRLIPERISRTIHLLSFLLSARIHFWFKKSGILYTRESLANFFFRYVVLEVHMPEQLRYSGLRAKKFVVLNSFIKDKIMALGKREENILVSPDGVDLSKFIVQGKGAARQKLGLPAGRGIALYSGNFKAWKGVDVLVATARLLPEIFFVMVGGTKDSDFMRIEQETAGLENVRLESFKPQGLIPAYLAAADVLVLPNTATDENSKFYTSPLKLFEYMATERPIIASNLPSLREILNDENAVLFEPDNPESLAKSIRQIIADSALASSISKAAKKKVEGYSWEARAQAVLHFIRND